MLTENKISVLMKSCITILEKFLWVLQLSDLVEPGIFEQLNRYVNDKFYDKMEDVKRCPKCKHPWSTEQTCSMLTSGTLHVRMKLAAPSTVLTAGRVVMAISLA